jgi:CHAD domain-containing protein
MKAQSIENLRTEIEKMTAHDSFEKVHFVHVEQNSISLAQMRNLDVDTACLIAWLHDIGRIKYGYHGKKHAVEGAIEAEKILKKISVEKVEIMSITTAIYNHRRKHRIDDEYSELIKDADSLAHQIEFSGNIDYYEELRCQMAFQQKCQLKFNKEADVKCKLLEVWVEFKSQIKRVIMGDIDADLVHDTRINIRRIRAILKTVRYDSLEIFEAKLKSVFELYSDPREAHVLMEQIEKIGKVPWLEVQLKDIRDEMQIDLRESIGLLEDQLVFEWLDGQLEKIVNDGEFIAGESEGGMNRYLKAIQQAKLKDVETLHRLRIRGKTVKYLVQLELFTMDQDCFRLVKYMHSLIGNLHDVDVNRVLLTQEKYLKNKKLTEKEYERIWCFFSKWEEEIMEEIEGGLFELNLRFRKPGRG